MSVKINVLERLAKLVREKGFDPEAFIIEAIGESLGLDPLRRT